MTINTNISLGFMGSINFPNLPTHTLPTQPDNTQPDYNPLPTGSVGDLYRIAGGVEDGTLRILTS